MANSKATERNDVQAEGTERQAPPDLTPYAAAQVTTAKMRQVLRAAGRDEEADEFEMAPQTMYGLAKRGVIETTKKAGSKKVYFLGTAFEVWLRDYVTGNTSGENGVRKDYDKLAEQYLTDTAGIELSPEALAAAEDENGTSDELVSGEAE